MVKTYSIYIVQRYLFYKLHLLKSIFTNIYMYVSDIIPLQSRNFGNFEYCPMKVRKLSENLITVLNVAKEFLCEGFYVKIFVPKTQ